MRLYRYFFGFTLPGIEYDTSFGVITLPFHIHIMVDVMADH